MSQLSEILSKKDLFCTQCVKTLEKVSDLEKREKDQINSLLLFMAGVYLYWIVVLIALVRLS